MKRKLIISLFSVIVILVGIYWYADRELIALKTGSTLPLQWDTPYNNDEQPIQLTEQNQDLKNPNIHLTELYYLPTSKKLQFGLWYSKRDYQPDKSKKFQIEFSKLQFMIKMLNCLKKIPLLKQKACLMSFNVDQSL